MSRIGLVLAASLSLLSTERDVRSLVYLRYPFSIIALANARTWIAACAVQGLVEIAGEKDTRNHRDPPRDHEELKKPGVAEHSIQSGCRRELDTYTLTSSKSWITGRTGLTRTRDTNGFGSSIQARSNFPVDQVSLIDLIDKIFSERRQT